MFRGELDVGSNEELQSAMNQVNLCSSSEDQIMFPGEDDPPLAEQQIGRTLAVVRSKPGGPARFTATGQSTTQPFFSARGKPLAGRCMICWHAKKLCLF